MKIEVSLTPALYPYRTLKENHVTVAIDVLRATTAVCAAFMAGCREVVPLDTLEALEPYRKLGYGIAAERGGKKLPGSDYGNSPTEYMSKDMSGVRLAYSTTNGTVSILKGADAALTLVGAFANLDALCERLKKEGRDVVLLCSGWQNDFCLEDTLVAGAIISIISEMPTAMRRQWRCPYGRLPKTILSLTAAMPRMSTGCRPSAPRRWPISTLLSK